MRKTSPFRSSRFILVLLFLLAGPNLLLNEGLKAQNPRPSYYDKVSIPFTYQNNFIIVSVVLQKLFPLQFIFDTGAEHTLITKREITDLLQVDYRRSFPIRGSDLDTQLVAFLATGMSLQVGEMSLNNRSVLVLERDVFRFEDFAGMDIHGILGADIFWPYVVKIDYRRQVITLVNPSRFKPSRKYTAHPLEVYRNKPYLEADIHLANDSLVKSKLLLDTGASLGLLLYTDTHPSIQVPENALESNIGWGLGGYLKGFLGRVDRFEIEDYGLPGVITNYQQLPTDVDSSFRNARNGIVGNVLLSRFTVVIDYFREQLYLKPTRKWKKKFTYDRSGLVIVAGGPELNQYTVFYILDGSPADRAGVRIGDRILKINGIGTRSLDIDSIYRRLRKRIGKRIKLKLEREGEEIKVVFYLEKLI